MKTFNKVFLVSIQALLCASCSGGGTGNNSNSNGDSNSTSENITPVQVYEDDDENISLTDAVKINCDFSKISDPALIKKVDMYNAGCVNPVTNYERDMNYAKMLNSHSLRLDASIGKGDGNGGEFLVSDDYDIYDEDDETDTYKVDIDSLKYDFSDLDQTLSYFNEMDTLPYVSWCYIPTPLQDNSSWRKLDTHVANWQEVFEEVYYNYAKHYLDNNVKIGYHEIYNEPDLEILKYFGVFSDDTHCFLDIDSFAPLLSDGVTRSPAAGCYPDMYEYGVKGILRADPDATVGGPSFALGEIGVEDWVGFIPRVLNKKLPLDFYSFHTYLDGDTWYMSDAQREAGSKNEIEKVVAGLSNNAHFLKTAVHINEYSCVNTNNGLFAGDNADFNYYYGAGETLDSIFEAVDRTSVQQINWAQLISCATYSNEPYGLIDRNGNPKAAFNSVLMYQDMPVWRYTSSTSDDKSGLKTVVSSDDEKISILIWNENKARDDAGNAITTGDRLAAVNLTSPKFNGGTRKVYRIDKTHASNYDGTLTKLPSYQNKKTLTGSEEYVWQGNVPAQGVVYITINKDDVEDFNFDTGYSDFANTIKKQYYYEDRYRGLTGSRESYSDFTKHLSGSYSMFDEKNWTTYLGLGTCEGDGSGNYKNQAVASTAVTCDDLPTSFKINVSTDGKVKALNRFSNLSVRIDFYDDATKSYSESVTLHNGVFNKDSNPNEQDNKLSSLSPYPWGSEKLTDKEVKYSGDVWDVNLNEIAPSGWLTGSRRAMISYTMRNTGANTRCAISLTK